MMDYYKDPRRTQNHAELQKTQSSANDREAHHRRSNADAVQSQSIEVPNLAQGLIRRDRASEIASERVSASLPFVTAMKPSTMLNNPHHSHLKPIVWMEGSFSKFPTKLQERLNKFCRANNTSDVPGAGRLWSGATTGMEATGRRKIWVTIPDGNELQVSRFGYGTTRQLLVARGHPGSKWEAGANVIIFFANNNMYKIWRGQKSVKHIPVDDIKVLCRSVGDGPSAGVKHQATIQPELGIGTLDLRDRSQFSHDRQAALELGTSDEVGRVSDIKKSQGDSQQKPPHAAQRIQDLSENPFRSEDLASPESTTPTALPAAHADLGGKQPFTPEDNALDDSESDNMSVVSDVPYAWAGSQTEPGAHSQSSLPLVVPAWDTVDANSLNVPSTDYRQQARGLRQVPDDSDDEPTQSPSATARLAAVREPSGSGFRSATERTQASTSPSYTGRHLPTQVSPSAPPAFTGSRSIQKTRLKALKPWDGSIQVFPQQLRKDLEKWCKLHDTRELPCAKYRWSQGDTVEVAASKKSVTKRKRTWVTGSRAEELRIGRFKYGSDQQLIIVQAQQGSSWEGGAAVIIVHLGIFSSQWKVWRGEENIEDIPRTRNDVWCEFDPEGLTQDGVDEDATQSERTTADERRRARPNRLQGGIPESLGQPPSIIRKTLSDRYRRQTKASAIDNTSGFQTDRESHNGGLNSSAYGVHQTPAARNGTEPRALKRRRRHSESTDSDVPIAATIPKRLPTARGVTSQGNDRTPSDQEVSTFQDHSDARTGKPPLTALTTVVGTSITPTSERSCLDSDDVYLKTVTVTPESSMKPPNSTLLASRDSQDRQTAYINNEVLPSGTYISGVRVLFVDDVGAESLDCLWGELQDTDDLFARARVAGITNKKSRLLEVRVGSEILLIQKRFDKDFEEVKEKILNQDVKEIRVECGD